MEERATQMEVQEEAARFAEQLHACQESMDDVDALAEASLERVEECSSDEEYGVLETYRRIYLIVAWTCVNIYVIVLSRLFFLMRLLNGVSPASVRLRKIIHREQMMV